MILEMFKCRVVEIGNHERGTVKNHAAKLQYKSPFPPQDFSVANCQSGTFKMLNLICLYLYIVHKLTYIILAIDFFNIQEINSLVADLYSREITSTKGRTSFKSLAAIIYFHTGIFVEAVYYGTDEEYRTGSSASYKRYVANRILQCLFKTISMNPNPSGEKFWDVMPIRKSAIEIHHPINISYDTRPSELTTRSTEFMISELKRGKCMAVWRGDHTVITMYEKGVVKEVPEWMKDISRCK